MSNFDGGTCEDVSCNDIYEEKACKDAGCTFDEDMYICYNDTGKACSTYSSFSSCPPNRCIFNYDEVRKHVCGCSPSILLPPPPPSIFSPFVFFCSQVVATHVCHCGGKSPVASGWADEHKQTNVRNLSRLCTCDPVASPQLQGSNKGTCQEKSCKDMQGKEECLALAGCQYVDSAGICFKDTGKPCSQYTDYADCPETRCSWAAGASGKEECEPRVSHRKKWGGAERSSEKQ